jgi:molybdopterin-containing oxidoreductase family membrane subunit
LGIEHLLPRRGSPVRFVTLAMGIAGAAAAFWLCIGSALIYALMVGGKQPVSILPYCVIGFELAVLLGGASTLAAVLVLARLRPLPPAAPYDPRFGEDRFGICVSCPASQASTVTQLLQEAGAEEIRRGDR